MTGRSRSIAQLGRLSGGIPRVWSRHRTELGHAYRLAFLALEQQYGKPARRGELETAMSRAAIARARLVLATSAWEALASRRRHTDDSRAELRAAEKVMTRADEALSRALADLRDALPPPPPPLSKRERELERRRAPFVPPHEVLARQRAADAEAENGKAGTESEQRTV